MNTKGNLKIRILRGSSHKRIEKKVNQFLADNQEEVVQISYLPAVSGQDNKPRHFAHITFYEQEK